MFSWRTTFFENVFLDVDNSNDVFGNRLEFVLPRMTYLLDNNNFQTAPYFRMVLHVDVFELIQMLGYSEVILHCDTDPRSYRSRIFSCVQGKLWVSRPERAAPLPTIRAIAWQKMQLEECVHWLAHSRISFMVA